MRGHPAPLRRRRRLSMSFAEYVTALRACFGVPDDAPLPAAVEMMKATMGEMMNTATAAVADRGVKRTFFEYVAPGG